MTDDLRHQIVELLPRLRRFAYALTGDRERGDDLVQETCVRALSKLDQWQRDTRLDSWMYRIAQNLWFDRNRARKVRGELVDIDAANELPGEDGRAITEGRSTLRIVSQAIETLTKDQQILITLVCLDGLSYKEAADELKVPIGTVMSRLARARRALYEATEDLKADPTIDEVDRRRV